MRNTKQGLALADLHVTEFGGSVASAYCGALLRACGADVVKVEPTDTGDTIRRLPPYAPGVEFPEASGIQTILDAGKRSVSLGESEDGFVATARDLALSADIVIEARGADFLSQIGLQEPKPEDPIVLSLSWFGRSGPARHWQGSDAVIQAMAAHVHAIGPAEGPPILPGGYQAQISAGVTAFVAVMAALVNRAEGGGGTLIEQSVFEAYLAYAEPGAVRYAYEGTETARMGRNRFPPVYPQTIYPTEEGWLGVTALTPLQWKACCELLGLDDLIGDSRFATANLRSQNADALDARMIPALSARSADYWFHEGQARRLPFALVTGMEQMLGLEHFLAREVFAEYVHPSQGSFRAPAIPFKFTATPVHAGGRAPKLGEHHAKDVLRERDVKSGTKTAQTTMTSEKLSGIRVIDFTMGWAGPLATRQLADLGADVIKIESESRPDWWRGFEITPESLARGDHERNPPYNHINRNKRGVAIDLAKPDGRALALRLVAQADAVIENQATGVMDKLGLSWKDLHAANPQIIMVSLPGYGSFGPWSGYRGYGSTFEQAAGIPHLTGAPDDPPLQSHIAYGDACGGLFSAAALLVALHHKRRTGEGQRVDLSQVETMLQLAAHGPVAYGLTGEAPPRTGNRHPLYCPHGCFPAAGEDRWVVVSVTDDAMWPALAKMIGRPDLAADPKLRNVEGRRTREAEIEAAIAGWTRAKTPSEAATSLQVAGVAAGQVNRPFHLLDDSHLSARGFWQVVDRAYVGKKPHPTTPFLMNGQRGNIRWPAPLLGEHTREVLEDVLGLSPRAVEELKINGIIGTGPTDSGTIT